MGCRAFLSKGKQTEKLRYVWSMMCSPCKGTMAQKLCITHWSSRHIYAKRWMMGKSALAYSYALHKRASCGVLLAVWKENRWWICEGKTSSIRTAFICIDVFILSAATEPWITFSDAVKIHLLQPDLISRLMDAYGKQLVPKRPNVSCAGIISELGYSTLVLWCECSLHGSG